jgi:hypothetical protein
MSKNKNKDERNSVDKIIIAANYLLKNKLLKTLFRG